MKCEYYKLGTLVERKIGYGIVQPGSNQKQGTPIIKVNNIISGLKSITDLDCTTEQISSKYERTKLRGGELIISVVGTIGKTAIVPKSFAGCNLVRATAMIDIPDLQIAKWVKYYLDSPNGQAYIHQNLNTTVQPTLNIKSLSEMPIPFYSDAQMQRMIAVLESLDDKIELNNKINENLAQQAMTVFRSWFVDYIPYGGTAPKEWRNVILDNITSLVMRGIAPKYSNDSDQTVINQKCIRNHMIDLSLARTHTPKAINEKWLQYGDLLINSTGTGTLGRTAQVWFKPKNLTVDSHVTIVRPAKENLIFYIGLWGISHEKEIESLHTGSTGQTELPRDRVKAMELLLPDDVALNRFHSIIAPLAASIVSNQEENLRLAELRDILLPKLMSGEIDIGDVDI
jgi:type I restriction enzyme S subunit